MRSSRDSDEGKSVCVLADTRATAGKIPFPGRNYDKYLASRLTTLLPLASHAN